MPTNYAEWKKSKGRTKAYTEWKNNKDQSNAQGSTSRGSSSDVPELTKRRSQKELQGKRGSGDPNRRSRLTSQQGKLGEVANAVLNDQGYLNGDGTDRFGNMIDWDKHGGKGSFGPDSGFAPGYKNSYDIGDSPNERYHRQFNENKRRGQKIRDDREAADRKREAERGGGQPSFNGATDQASFNEQSEKRRKEGKRAMRRTPMGG